MSDKSVLQLAEVIGIPLDRLLEQLKEAGLTANAANDVISEDEKMKLLAHLRKRHGKADDLGDSSLPKRVTLKRRQVTSLKQTSVPGTATKTISIEVRKEKTYIKRPEHIDTGFQAIAEAPSVEAANNLNADNAELVHEPSAPKEQTNIASVFNDSEEQYQAEPEPITPAIAPAPALEGEALRLENAINSNAEKVIRQAAARQQVAAGNYKKPYTSNTGSRTATDNKNATTATDNRGSDAKKPYTPRPAATANPVAPAKANFGADKKKGSTFQGADKKKSGGQNADGREVDIKKGWSKKSSKQKGRQNDSDAKHQFERPVAPVIKEVAIPEFIIVSELAQKMSVKVAEVIKQLMKLGVMATINQAIDQDTAVLLVEEMGHTVLLQSDDALEQEMLAELTAEACEEMPRAPIVTIMGHVDHGKTSLLDYIRKTRVAAGEAGGITQHIGAYQVITDHGSVTFLDTPGHAAFTAMRARGAEVTDVVIVVVAADDGVMPQTKEAVEHARAANVPLIVAINKIDKPSANPEKVMQEMSTIGVLSEEWGGDVQFIKISAKTGAGIDDLIEALILQTEILELKAPVEGAASGFVIESRLDRGRGAVATVLIQKGTLEKGQFVLCGHEYGRIRAMFNENGKPVKEAGPCAPVEILGLSGTPLAGDEFLVVQNEKVARELASHREDRTKSNRMAAQQATKLDDVFSKMGAGQSASLNLVVKTDVHGSLEALRGSLVALSSDEVEVKVVFGGVGGINESDVNLALASGAIIIGFNVRADTTARKLIEEKDVDLHYYSIIYEAIDEVKKSISGMLSPEIKEIIVGLAEVRDVFKSPKLGAIAGCMVIDGYVKRNLPIRVLRNNVVIYEGQLESLRRFKDDAAEVKMGMECGIGVKNYTDVQAGDQIEVFERKEVIRTI
ncbi:MAG: translation initiation factor IF-2 [Methylococcaceae bacterium]|nr:translation initiation factor IF-2 [Methylococcaceae bacterium]